jgi:hypothetical protein
LILSEETRLLTAVYQPVALAALQEATGWGPPLTWDKELLFQLTGAQLALNRTKCRHPKRNRYGMWNRCVACDHLQTLETF